MRSFPFAVGLVVLVVQPLAAHAHFGPAEPPDFGLPDCMMVVDKLATPTVQLTYDLGFDDTEPEIGHIIIRQSKTHQFFAFRGEVIQALPRFEYRPFATGAVSLLPLWYDQSDLQTADAANDPAINPDFHALNIGDNVLVQRMDLAGQWFPISDRVPITIEQSSRGITWDLTNVEPGVYQVVSYTFSPPFNDWQPRPGVIKVVAGGDNPPAVTVDSIDAITYSGQGRRVTGCVDAPAGSSVSASYRLDTEEDVEANWHPWTGATPIANGKLDLCFGSPDPALSGMVHLRVSVKAPDGRQTFAVAPDPLVIIGMPEACVPSETQCCMFSPPPMAAAAGPAGNTGTMTSGQLAAGSGAAGAAAVQPAAPSAPAADGCSLVSRSERSGASSLFVLAACLWFVRRRVRRLS